MRHLYFLFDLLLILLVGLLAWWAVQHYVCPLPPVTGYYPDSGAYVYPPDMDYVPYGMPPYASIYPPDMDYYRPEDAPALPELPLHPKPRPILRPRPPEHVAKLVNSVFAQTGTTRSYNPAYVRLAYPGGDVDESTGVCTDVVIRSFRAQGVDLQKAVHEDMRKHFRKYPQKWGLRSPDTNIDHRRVPNLATFFERKGKSLPVAEEPDAYLPGDVVVWALNETQQHIGVVLTVRSEDGQRPLIGHNINQGAMVEDVLFAWPIIGHYRYFEPLLADSTQ